MPVSSVKEKINVYSVSLNHNIGLQAIAPKKLRTQVFDTLWEAGS